MLHEDLNDISDLKEKIEKALKDSNFILVSFFKNIWIEYPINKIINFFSFLNIKNI